MYLVIYIYMQIDVHLDDVDDINIDVIDYLDGVDGLDDVDGVIDYVDDGVDDDVESAVDDVDVMMMMMFMSTFMSTLMSTFMFMFMFVDACTYFVCVCAVTCSFALGLPALQRFVRESSPEVKTYLASRLIWLESGPLPMFCNGA